MSEQNGTSTNGGDRTPASNGAIQAAGAATPVPSSPKPAIPARPLDGRTAGDGPELEGLRTLASRGAAPSAKLQATTRVMNAVLGYITGPLGREADKLTEADVAAIGSILGTLDGLDTGYRRT